MLKVRVIPTLLHRDLGLVKGVAFESTRRVGPLVPALRVYARRDVDELILLDVSATREGRTPDLRLVREAAEHATVPLTYGGGIRTVEQAIAVVEAGADRIVLNSHAYPNPGLVRDCAGHLGSQSVVGCIDYRRVGNGWTCAAVAGGRPTGDDPVERARTLEALGAGEVMLCEIDRDGTMTGYGVEMLARVARTVNVPVIASGGAGSPEDMRRAVEAGASAVAAASIFHFTEQTPQDAKDYLARHGIPVRVGIADPGGQVPPAPRSSPDTDGETS